MALRKIIVVHRYVVGSAATNRILAYVNGFHEVGLEVVVVLGMSKQIDIPILTSGITIIICQSSHMGINYLMSKKVKEQYTQGESAVLIYGSPAICCYLSKFKYNIFYECTEVPFYGRKKTILSCFKEGVKDFLVKRSTGMLVISNELAKFFKKKGVENIAVVNMFVDAERFENVMVKEEGAYIAYCGTISPFKDGVDYLIEAFGLFYKKHSDYGLKLIGRFESVEAENMLRKLVAEHHLEQAISFTGMIKPEEMPQLLCGARMLALARPDNEQAKYGFPTKLGEYLATGKPVVVTNVGEIGLFLKDGVNCRMANPGDEIDFADKLSWVADNYDEALKLGEKGKELTKKEFSSVEQTKVALAFMENIIIKQRRIKDGI